MSEYTFTRADVGCFLDGAMGWHNTYRVIELAQEHGFVLSETDAQYVSAYRSGGTSDGDEMTIPGISDVVHEISEEATEYLNSITAPGLYWEWEMGELCLMADDGTEDWPVMSDQDIIDRAVRHHRNGEVITDGEARVIAAAWHGGQTSALFALATSGAIDADRAVSELDREWDSADPADRGELSALADYVGTKGNRGPVVGWHMLWGDPS